MAVKQHAPAYPKRDRTPVMLNLISADMPGNTTARLALHWYVELPNSCFTMIHVTQDHHRGEQPGLGIFICNQAPPQGISPRSSSWIS
jgi:hypothetical protein